jgi:hypothetical protein
MATTDGFTQADIDKWENIIAVMSAGAKSSQMRDLQAAKAHKELVQALIAVQGLTKDEAEAKAKQLKKDEEDAVKAEQRNKALAEGFIKAVAGAKNFASGSISASQSVYNANDAFQAAVPTLDLLSTAAKDVAQVIATAFSGLPYVGALLGATAQGASAYIEISTQLAKANFENASKYMKTYSELSSVGVTFGGDLTELGNKTHDLGISLDSYATFVKQSKDSLSQFGDGTTSASMRIATMGKEVRNANINLAAMYGTVEDFDSALAGYSGMLASYGVDTVKNQDNIKASSASYLRVFKDLTDLTGKSLDAQIKDEEKRRENSAYEDAMSEAAARSAADKNDHSFEALRVAVATATKLVGPGFDQVMTELVGHQGEVRSVTSTVIKEQAPAISEILRATEEMARSGKYSAKEIQEYMADQVQIHRAEIESDKQRLSEMTKNTDASTDEFLTALRKAKSGLIETEDARSNALATIKKQATEATAAPKQAAKDFVEAVNQLQNFKIQMDKYTADHLGELGSSAEKLIKFQKDLQEIFGGDSGFQKAMLALIPALRKLAGLDEGESWKSKAIDYGATAVGAAIGGFGGLGVGTVPGAIAGGIAGHTAGTAINDYFGIGGTSGAPATGALSGSTLPGGANGLAPPSIPPGFGINGTQGTGGVTPELNALLMQMAGNPLFAGTTITSLNDADSFVQDGKHPHAAPDKHGLGKAVDFNIAGYDPKKKDDYISALLRMGFSQAQFETAGQQNANGSVATGNHIHAALAKGGITEGPSLAGEAGPEAVVPLPDGRTIPVKMDVGELVEKLEEMISVMKDHRDTSEKILHATT